MKPFNLEEAKAGKPVCTREGYAARILCFDAENADYPIAALVKDSTGEEHAETYTKDGRYYSTGETRSQDLVMLPVQYTVWVNLYAKAGDIPTVGVSYPTEEQARQGADKNRLYLGAFPITYED